MEDRFDGAISEPLPADQFVPDSQRIELVERRPRLFGRIEDVAFLRPQRAGHEVNLYQRIG